MGLESSLANLEQRRKDMENYARIMNAYRNIDVSCNEEFQRKYNRFYRVRRNSAWRQIYYRLFEDSKGNDGINFEYILRTIFEHTGRIEPSFSSKMLATLKPEMPIWDSIVLSKLGMKLKQNIDKETRLKEASEIYNSIVAWYKTFGGSLMAQQFVEAFDRAFPEFIGFSKTKKIDFLIWGSGDADPFAN